MNTIDIITLISPRLEFWYLEEWIEHHLSIGINKIYIYNNGFNLISNEKSPCNQTSWWAQKTFKNKKCQGEISKTWDLKPKIDHFEDFSESQITKAISRVQDKYNNVNIIPWEYAKDHKDKYPDSQYSALRDFLTKSQSDFFAFIDVDEYFVLPKSKSLQDLVCDIEFDSLKIPQKAQPRRSREKVLSMPDSNQPLETKWGKNITRLQTIKDLVCENEKEGRWPFENWNHHDGFDECLFSVTTSKGFHYNHYKLST
tara:strand:- start:762 stop:1529 length:768 start_codon:yes stop_codon:yes gene_type:complete